MHQAERGEAEEELDETENKSTQGQLELRWRGRGGGPFAVRVYGSELPWGLGTQAQAPALLVQLDTPITDLACCS